MRPSRAGPLVPPLVLIVTLSACMEETSTTFTPLTPELSRSSDMDGTPPFDFSDDFYRANGVDPANIVSRVGTPARNPAHWVVDGSNTDPDFNDVRILETTGGWDASGNLLYYYVPGMMKPATFTDDEAGAEARALAEAYRAFLFPKTNPDRSAILSPAPPNRRQDNVFDTRNGYSSNNPLGLWLLTFVVYTDAAFETEEGQKELEKLAERNGVDLDGTPIINKASDIDRLAAKGIVELRFNPESGGDGPRWVI